MKRVLIVSQSIGQSYIDIITAALGENTHVDIITGSKIAGNVIESPAHNPLSLKSRLKCWIQHYLFIKKWIKENKNNHYDLIFATSNPPINSYIGLLLKKEFNAPFVFMNWDLYPQIIAHSIKNPVANLFVKMWKSWNNRNFGQIDKIITIGQVMTHSINNELKSKLSIDVVPISVDVDKLVPIQKEKNPFIIQNGLSSKFIVLYSGKMGMGHDIECILRASTLLSGISDIMFVFIGHGTKYDVVKDFISQNKSTNVKLFPLQPKEIFPFSMACGDIGIVSQEAKMAHLFMPSKTYSMMACGQAIIGISSGNDDLSLLIEKNQIGYVVNDSSELTLANYIKELYDNKKKLDQMKKNARKTVEEHYAISVVKKLYSKVFDEVLK